MVDLHLQGKSIPEISIELEKDRVIAPFAAIEKHLGQKFGYCRTHCEVMTWEHKCPKC